VDQIALFGIGKLGRALLTGWTAAGIEPGRIRGVERDEAKAEQVRASTGIEVLPAKQAVAGADAVVLAVLPNAVPEVLDEIAADLDPDCLVLSLAAGVSTEVIGRHLPAGIAVVRAMPNTAVAVQEGMCVLSGGPGTDREHMLRAEKLLRPVGAVVRVPEDQQDVATALTGSAPAYFYEIFDAMTNAGVRLGVSEEAARLMVIQSAAGAVAMVRHTRQSPATLRDAVATPGGATAAALAVFEQHKARDTVNSAIEAAARRSAELGAALNDGRP
jgi:pyrroline-5-carboxylate reductase